MNKKIILSLSIIGIAAAIAIGGTVAYFSDTETSTGNTFAAGSLDLIVNVDNSPMASPVFSLLDMKPGDLGEKTFSLRVDNNPACTFVNIDLKTDADGTCTEPEGKAVIDTNCADADGELNDEVEFAIWGDTDCDNVYDPNETILTQGTLTEGREYAIGEIGSVQQCYGLGYCFGSFTVVEVGGVMKVKCNGALIGNESQTDTFTADLEITAEQKRNQYPNECPVGDITSTPAPAPVVDGVISTGEWDGCTDINFASAKGTACVIAYPDYMYVKYVLSDPTDDRQNNSYPGNDKLGLNINPNSNDNWGKPYDIVFQTGTDDAAFTTPNPDVAGNSGMTDGWLSEWVVDGTMLLALPGDVQTMTLSYAGTRISEWKLPLASIAGLSSGNTLKVGGAADIELGSYAFPSTLNWSDVMGTFVDIIVK